MRVRSVVIHFRAGEFDNLHSESLTTLNCAVSWSEITFTFLWPFHQANQTKTQHTHTHTHTHTQQQKIYSQHSSPFTPNVLGLCRSAPPLPPLPPPLPSWDTWPKNTLQPLRATSTILLHNAGGQEEAEKSSPPNSINYHYF